jgi:hypothetical protein
MIAESFGIVFHPPVLLRAENLSVVDELYLLMGNHALMK